MFYLKAWPPFFMRQQYYHSVDENLVLLRTRIKSLEEIFTVE